MNNMDLIRTFGSPERVRKAEEMEDRVNHAVSMALEERFVTVIADRAVTVVADRLKERRGTTVAPIDNAPSLRVQRTSLNEWLKQGQDSTLSVKFMERVTDKVARRLGLERSQVTAEIEADRANNISRIVFRFAEPVTRVPTN